MIRYLLLAILVALPSGCAFGTNHVTVPARAAAPSPSTGTTMSVRVMDARTDLSGAQVGVKRNSYGAKTGSVELEGGQALSSLYGADLVSILRERGYRADGPSGPLGELEVVAEIVSFGVDTQHGFWSGSVQGVAVVRLTIRNPTTNQQVWSDVVRAQSEESGIQFVSEADHQAVVEKLYQQLLQNTQAAVPDGRAPLRAARLSVPAMQSIGSPQRAGG